jgi:predicted ribosomally synthesized peptide with nif11-like leader
MSKEAVVTFLKAVDENEQLRKELFAKVPAKSSTAPKIATFAQEHGFAFTEDELEEEARSHAATKGEAIGEKELDAVVGGTSFARPIGMMASNLLLNVHALNFKIPKLFE